MREIFQLLNPSNTLTVNRLLAHSIGLSEAVVYAALISKCSYYERSGKLDDGGWFYSTVPDLEASTALSEYQQKRCIANLVKAGLIESKNRGLPAKRSFRIIEDVELIESLISAGEKKQMSIKPAAAQSYEKKRKAADSDTQTSCVCSEKTTEQVTDTTMQDYGDFIACSEETTEQASKKLSPLLQRNRGASSGNFAVPFFSKSKENKSKDKNHLSINHTCEETDMIDMIDDNLENSDFSSNSEQASYLDIIHKNIGYKYLVGNYPEKKCRIDEIVGIMLDVICSKREFIRVNGEDIPQRMVKSQFLKLDEEHIDYVLMAMDKNSGNIHNIRSYLITALYNAPLTMDNFYTSLVNHDMYGK